MKDKLLAEYSVPLLSPEDDFSAPADIPTIWINEFTEETTQNFFRKFNALYSDDRTHAIVLYIDSYGGNVDSLTALCELVGNSKKPIITVAIGKAMSAGALLLSLGSEGMRYAGPSTSIMLHRFQITDLEGDVAMLHSMIESFIKESEEWLRKIVDRSKLTWKAFNTHLEKHGGTWYMKASEAQKYGFIDKIGIPIIRKTQQVKLIELS